MDQRDEFELSSGNWAAQSVPGDFAARVAGMSGEESRQATRGRGRGLVIPLLLAALLISAGALAAWQGMNSGALAASDESDSTQVEPALRKLNFDTRATRSFAEPENAQEVTPQFRRRAPFASLAAAETELEVDEVERPMPPKIFHVPRCECGTSGIICSCVD